MWAASRLGPSLNLGSSLRLGGGAAFGFAGAFFLSQGFLAFRKARTTIDPVRIDAASSVVTSGIYRYTRNPMYVGMAAVLIGWGLYLGGAWALPGPVAFVLFTTRFQIAPEERTMSARFGRGYEEYRQRVRRWL